MIPLPDSRLLTRLAGVHAELVVSAWIGVRKSRGQELFHGEL